MTAAICLAEAVEATVPKSVLRTTMSLVGGVLGYLVMLNGRWVGHTLGVSRSFLSCYLVAAAEGSGALVCVPHQLNQS